MRVVADLTALTPGPGDYFGEIALLYRAPRTATVAAATELRTLSFDGAHFVATVTGYLGSTEMIGAVAQPRIDGNREFRGSEE